jgi:hypothetical protein
MKPNLKQMSDDQLREYIKQHRTDNEAIAELFVNRRSSDAEATWYATAGVSDTVDVIKKQIDQRQAGEHHAS